NAITHFDQRALDRAGHAVEELELETAAVDADLFRERLCMRDAADIVRTERRGHDRFVFEQDARERFEVYVALRLLQIERTIPAILTGLNFFVIPIRAFDDPEVETRTQSATPLDHLVQVSYDIAQV